MSVSVFRDTQILAPVAKVWEFLIKPENYPTMNPLCVENSPATITPATETSPEKREWTAVEVNKVLGSLITQKVVLTIVGTLAEPGKLLIHDIKTDIGVTVHITYAIEEESREGGGVRTVLKDTATLTTPWYMRGFAAAAAKKAMTIKSQSLKDALDEK